MAQSELKHLFSYIPAKVQSTQYFKRVMNREGTAKEIRMVIKAADGKAFPPASHRHSFIDLEKNAVDDETKALILRTYYSTWDIRRDQMEGDALDQLWSKFVRGTLSNVNDKRFCPTCKSWSEAVTNARQNIKAELRRAQNFQAFINTLPKDASPVERAERMLRYDLTHNPLSGHLGLGVIRKTENGEVKTEKSRQAACYGSWPHMHPSYMDAGTGSKLERYVEDSLRHSRAQWKWESWPFQDYLHWVLNHSPYARAFITKDAKDVFHNGWIANLDMSGKYMAGAGKSIRIIDEFPKRLLFWRVMRDKIPPRLLSFLMQATQAEFKGTSRTCNRWKQHLANGCDADNPTITDWYYYPTWNYGHSVFHDTLSTVGLRRYLQGDPLREAFSPPFRKDMSYRGQMDIWGTRDLGDEPIQFPQPGEAGVRMHEQAVNNYVCYDPTQTDKWIEVFAKLNDLKGYIE